jgi:hypothetical protein
MELSIPILIKSILMVLCPLAVAIFNYCMGHKHGTKNEKERCETILEHSIRIRFSPTTREALVCIAGNQTKDQMIKSLEELNAHNENSKDKQ